MCYNFRSPLFPALSFVSLLRAIYFLCSSPTIIRFFCRYFVIAFALRMFEMILTTIYALWESGAAIVEYIVGKRHNAPIDWNVARKCAYCFVRWSGRTKDWKSIRLYCRERTMAIDVIHGIWAINNLMLLNLIHSIYLTANGNTIDECRRQAIANSCCVLSILEHLRSRYTIWIWQFMHVSLGKRAKR